MGSNVTTHFSSLRLAPCCRGMAKQVKSGYMLHHKKRLFGKDWREEYVVLYSDSTLAWFRERDRLEPDGGLVIREAPHLLAIGQWTTRIPNRPELPPGRSQNTLIAFGCKNKDKVHWFLCRDEDDLSEWMTAISNTLPPPPFPQQAQGGQQTTGNAPYTVAPPPPLPVGYLPPPPPYSDAVPQPQYDNHHPLGPRTQPVQQMMPHPVASMAPQPPNNTTVIIQDGRRGIGGSSMDGFATGVLTGTMLNAALHGPSYGWGLGHGWGWGGHVGAWGGGVGYYNNDADTYINNHYQMNNTTVDNEYNVTNNYSDVPYDNSGGMGGVGVGNSSSAIIDYDNDYDDGGYDGGYDGGVGDGFDAGCDFSF